MTIDALMLDAMGNRIPDDSLSGILDILITTLSGNWHWNLPSILYVLTPLMVSLDAGEKKSFQVLLATIDVLGAAA